MATLQVVREIVHARGRADWVREAAKQLVDQAHLYLTTTGALLKNPLLAFAISIEPEGRAAREGMLRDEERFRELRKELGRLRRAAGMATPYPDANSTWRIRIGRVVGPPGTSATTTLAGIFGLATSRAPYALPQRWLDAKESLDLALPFTFTADTDCVFATNASDKGGPMLDASGKIIEMAYSTNEAGLGAEFRYDPNTRTVALTSGAIRHVLERVYGAVALAKEIDN